MWFESELCSGRIYLYFIAAPMWSWPALWSWGHAQVNLRWSATELKSSAADLRWLATDLKYSAIDLRSSAIDLRSSARHSYPIGTALLGLLKLTFGLARLTKDSLGRRHIYNASDYLMSLRFVLIWLIHLSCCSSNCVSYIDSVMTNCPADITPLNQFFNSPFSNVSLWIFISKICIEWKFAKPI